MSNDLKREADRLKVALSECKLLARKAVECTPIGSSAEAVLDDLVAIAEAALTPSRQPSTRDIEQAETVAENLMAKWRRERDEARAEADRVRRALECCEAALSEFEDEPVTTRVEITVWERVLLVALKRARAALLPTQQGGQKDAADVRDCGGEP